MLLYPLALASLVLHKRLRSVCLISLCWLLTRVASGSRPSPRLPAHGDLCVLSDASLHVLRLWLDLAESGTSLRSLFRAPRFECAAFADACASQSSAGLGGFVRLPSGAQLFFQKTFSRAELLSLFPWVALSDSVQSFIASWELLAQCALIRLLHTLLGAGHAPVHCVFRCDNAASDPASWKGISLATGLCSVLRSFFLAQHRHRISVYLDHVPGLLNDVADALSRSKDPAALGFSAQESVEIDWGSFPDTPSLSLAPSSSAFSGYLAQLPDLPA